MNKGTSKPNTNMSSLRDSQIRTKSESSLAQESSITDVHFVPEARFECPICLAWLRDPVVTSCGHRFCRNCMESWLERENPSCPIDNQKLQKDIDIFPDNFTRREISQQKIRCPNITKGCLEELSPLDVDAHLLVCSYNPPKLPENEKLRCVFVGVGCTEKFEDEPELQKHLKDEIHKHLDLFFQAHIGSIVHQNSASSIVAQQAQLWDPPSKSAKSVEILGEDGANSLIKALYEKIVILEQKTREQDIIIANISDLLSNIHVRYCNGSSLWYFKDFKQKINAMRNDSRIVHYSPDFYTSPDGYRLCVRLNLSPKDSNYIALIIHVMKTAHDNALDWPFSGRLSMTLVHPIQSSRNIKETMMTRPELEAFKQPIQNLNPKGFGYTEFALIEELFTLGFIENNQLLIKVQAKPI